MQQLVLDLCSEHKDKRSAMLVEYIFYSDPPNKSALQT